MQKVLVSPHNDDAALFAAFTCIEQKPLVVTVFDSWIQPKRVGPALGDLAAFRCSRDSRRAEDTAAMKHLGCRVVFGGLRDDQGADTQQIREAVMSATRIGLGHSFLNSGLDDCEIWVPLEERDGHEQHNAVARAFDGLALVHRYTTYTRGGGGGIRTQQKGVKVNPTQTSWVLNKLRALACYESQISIAELGCWPWFMGDQSEYIIKHGSAYRMS